MTKKVSGVQAGFILALTTISLKFLVYPSIFAKYAYRDVYIPMAIGLGMDFIFTLIILYVIKSNPHITLSQLLTRVMGKTVSKIIYGILFLRFFSKGIIAIKEVHNYFNETLFDNINWFVYMFPLFLLSGYMMLKDFRTFGRTIQFFIPLIIAALIFTIFVPATSADFSNILPMFEKGASGIFKALLYCAYAFGDYLILLLLMGNIDYRPNTNRTIIITLIVTDIIVVIFYVIFASIFKDTGLNRSLAISEMLLYTNINTATGTINWVNILVWLIIMFLQIGLMFYCSSTCLGEILSIKNKYINMSIVTVLAVITVFYLYLSLIRMLNIVTNIYASVFIISVQIILPILCLVSTLILNNKHRFNWVDVYDKKVIKYQLTDISGGTLKNKQFKLKM